MNLPRSNAAVLSTLFLFLCCHAWFTSAIIFDIDFPLSDKSSLTSITPISAFGYLPGGQLSVDLTISGTVGPEMPTVNLLLIPERYWVEFKQARLIGKSPDGGRQCSFLPSTYEAQFGQSHSLQFTTSPDAVVNNGRYLVIAANCPSPLTFHLKGTMTMVNPGGQHLSLEDIPMLSVSVALLSMYVCFAVAFAMYMFFAARRFILRIHLYILTCFVVKVIEMGLVYGVYSELSTTGRLSTGIDSLERLWKVVSDTMFLLLLFLVAAGWSITKETLSSRESRLCIGSFGLYLIFRALYALCTIGNPRLSPHNANQSTSVSQSASSSIPDDTTAVCAAYVLAFSVLSFLVIFGVIVSLNATIERLRAMYIEAHAWRNLQRLLRHRLHKYRAFRWAFLLYLVLPIVLVFIEFAILSWRQDWLVQTLQEGLIVFMILFVAFYFAPDERLIIPQRAAEAALGPQAIQAAMQQLASQQQAQQQQQQQQQPESQPDPSSAPVSDTRPSGSGEAPNVPSRDVPSSI